MRLITWLALCICPYTHCEASLWSKWHPMTRRVRSIGPWLAVAAALAAALLRTPGRGFLRTRSRSSSCAVQLHERSP